MPKNDIEKESLIALVLRYEQCYEEICNFRQTANCGPLQQLWEVQRRLDATFGSKGERT